MARCTKMWLRIHGFPMILPWRIKDENVEAGGVEPLSRACECCDSMSLLFIHGILPFDGRAVFLVHSWLNYRSSGCPYAVLVATRAA